jgi:hypothetical protein
MLRSNHPLIHKTSHKKSQLNLNISNAMSGAY